LNLITTYLSNRKQYRKESNSYVSIINMSSFLQNISIGVPQGSILEPFLFLAYISDIINSVESTPTLFADDTCLSIKSSSTGKLEILISNELKRISL